MPNAATFVSQVRNLDRSELTARVGSSQIMVRRRLWRAYRFSSPFGWSCGLFLQEKSMQTVVHVTHEAIQKIGGIGAVLQGLLTSKVYLTQASRNILVGPFWPADERGERRLGPMG